MPRRPDRGRLRLLRRWLPVAALVLVALLYYRPARTYLSTRDTVSERSAEVRALRAHKRALEDRVERTAGDEELARQARRLGLVKPGERLFIVKGIGAWRRARAERPVP